jgi:hypothetical protein
MSTDYPRRKAGMSYHEYAVLKRAWRVGRKKEIVEREKYFLEEPEFHEANKVLKNILNTEEKLT